MTQLKLRLAEASARRLDEIQRHLEAVDSISPDCPQLARVIALSFVATGMLLSHRR